MKSAKEEVRCQRHIKRATPQNFELLTGNPAHPSLHFKKVGTLSFVRGGINHHEQA